MSLLRFDDEKLVWRTPLIGKSSVMFAHHEGIDFLAVLTKSQPFDKSEMAGPMLWSIIPQSLSIRATQSSVPQFEVERFSCRR